MTKQTPTPLHRKPSLIVWACLASLLLCWPTSALAATIRTNHFDFVDLTSFATNSDLWARRGFSAMPKGLQAYGGVPFFIGVPTGLNGMESARAGEHFPTEITGIKIGGRVRRLHLLHATIGPDKDGVPVAKVIFNYADGSREALRIGYGVHVRDWTTPAAEKRSVLIDPNSSLAWSEGSEHDEGESRIFRTALENPRPSEELSSIDIVSLFSQATPFCLALSVERPGSTLPGNLPLPARKAVREMNELPDAAYRRHFVVRVTDSETGAPLSNAVASLTIAEEKEKTFWGETRTDAQGVARIAFPPQQTAAYTLWVHAPGRRPAILSESKTNVARFKEEHFVRLQPGTPIGGIVKRADGQPVASAQVVIHRVTRVSPHHYDRVDYDVVLTGPDGKWKSASLPPDLTGLSLHVTHPEHGPAHFVTAGFAPPPSTATTASSSASTAAVTYRRLPDGTLVPMNQTRGAAKALPLVTSNALLALNAEMIVRPAPLVQGTLAGPDGRPVDGAELIVAGFGSATTKRSATTDREGRFKLHVPEPGPIGLVAIHAGFAPLHQTVNVTTNTPALKLQMKPPQVVRGRVQDQKRRPVSGARVRVENWHGTSDIARFQATTDDDGRFVWSNAPSGQVIFSISKTNSYSSRQSFNIGSGEIILSMNQPPGIQGRVYDAATKQPIESFLIIPGRKYSQQQSQIQWDRSESVRGQRGEYTMRLDSYMFSPEARLLVEAPGYRPQLSPAFNGPDSYTNDFALEKGESIEGIVTWPDGSPAPNATVVLVERGENGYLQRNGQLQAGGSSDMIRTDAAGRFRFSAKLDPAMLFASHENGYGQTPLSGTNRVILRPWGAVKGVVRIGDKAEPDQSVRLENLWPRQIDENNRPTLLAFNLKVEADESGNFIFDKVPPGEHRLALEYRFRETRNGGGEIPLSHGFFVPVKSGETANVTLGGTGRKITGRVQLHGGEHGDVDWKRDVHKLMLVLPSPLTPPMAVAGRTQAEQQRAWNDFQLAQQNFWKSEAGLARQREERTYVLVFETNGVFRADNVPPGNYNLMLSLSDPEEEYYSGRAMGSTNLPVVVPNEPGAKVNAPFDIGTVHLTIRPQIKVGRPVPSFSGKTADGKTINLSDYRGKFVLLHFWGMSMGYSTYDFETLKQLQENFGSGGKLVILGCNLDGNQQNALNLLKRQEPTWPQIYLGEWNQSPVPGMFGVRGNTASVLIDPEGRLASGQLRGSSLRNNLPALLER